MVQVIDLLMNYPDNSEIIIHYGNRFYTARIKDISKGIRPKIILGIKDRVYKNYYYE